MGEIIFKSDPSLRKAIIGFAENAKKEMEKSGAEFYRYDREERLKPFPSLFGALLDKFAEREAGLTSLRFDASPGLAWFYLATEGCDWRFWDERRFPPLHRYWVPEKIALAAANVLSLATEERELTLVDIELFPVALLLSWSGWEINMALAPRERDALSPLTEKFSPRPWRALDKPDCGRGPLLGDDPSDLLTRRPDAGPEIRRRGGLFLASRDLSDLPSARGFRSLALNSLHLRAVAQMPRQRFSISGRPVLYLFDSKPSETVRLAVAEWSERGPEDLSQENCAEALFSEPREGISIDIPKSQLLKSSKFNISPTFWLTYNEVSPLPRTGLKLKDRCEILRCQLPREKREGPGQAAGDDSIICREVGINDFDAAFGRLLDERRTYVSFAGDSGENLEKYLLRKNDIVFAFRGSESAIGALCLIREKPAEDTVAGQAYCVVRPDASLDPFWLFWYLRSPQARKILQEVGGSGKVFNVSISELRHLPLAEPGAGEIAAWSVASARMDERLRGLDELTRKAKESRDEMEKIIEEILGGNGAEN